MKTTLFAVLVALACGCAHTPTEYAPTRDSRRVKIETDPPGMRCYFGIAGKEVRAVSQREYVGTSPCAVVIPTDGDYFQNNVSKFARPQAVFVAEPPSDSSNLYTQRQVFAVPALFIRPPAVPRAVFFDMHKPPPPP